MSAKDNVSDLEILDRMLQVRHQILVVFINEVGEIAVNEQFAGPGLGDLLWRYAAVRAADPHDFR